MVHCLFIHSKPQRLVMPAPEAAPTDGKVIRASAAYVTSLARRRARAGRKGKGRRNVPARASATVCCRPGLLPPGTVPPLGTRAKESLQSSRLRRQVSLKSKLLKIYKVYTKAPSRLQSFCPTKTPAAALSGTSTSF
ncbi:hypothetical protein E2C01_056726 [Portunus trituberculatus]|uniref:Uncharacterized protein n=1 Tax=Portunus trituberculatus TaxID=210409 RepID=A0A5B7GZY3_PORTR|nr:hypothetical protein [Portunus trituberculatus]